MKLATNLGGLQLRSPLIAASGTVGSIADFADLEALSVYGAAVAKSVSGEPWPGRAYPRMAGTPGGMLNGIGIQNPGIEAWREQFESSRPMPVPVWGSAVGRDAAEFARVAKGLEAGGVQAVEVNLSCPNLEGHMFALNPTAAAQVVAAVAGVVEVPIGAKLSPNSEDIVAVATAVEEAGAAFVTLTNTVWGFALDLEERRPVLSGGVGGYSGPAIKPIALRCVWEVSRALPTLPIVGCGGVRAGTDIVEYLMAGATAVAAGTIHFTEPRAGRRMLRELQSWGAAHGIESVSDLVGSATSW